MLPDFKAGSLNEIGSTTMAWVVGKLCRSLEVNLKSNGKLPRKLSTTDCTEIGERKKYGHKLQQ